MVGVYVEPVGVSGLDDAPFTQAGMPSASAVASGTVVYNSTYGIYLRSNGTRWIATSPFTVDQNVRTDTVTGASAESLMHSVDISDAVRYMGPKGRLRIVAGWTFPNTANAKTCRIRVGTTAGVSGTLYLTSASTGTGNSMADKTIFANGSEASQLSSSASTLSTAASGSFITSILNFAPGGNTVIVSFTSAPVGAGEVVTLNSYSISINPGF